jgi:hypothetical protein
MFLAGVVVYFPTMTSDYWPMTPLRAGSETEQVTDNHRTNCEVSVN